MDVFRLFKAEYDKCDNAHLHKQFVISVKTLLNAKIQVFKVCRLRISDAFVIWFSFLVSLCNVRARWWLHSTNVSIRDSTFVDKASLKRGI